MSLSLYGVHEYPIMRRNVGGAAKELGAPPSRCEVPPSPFRQRVKYEGRISRIFLSGSPFRTMRKHTQDGAHAGAESMAQAKFSLWFRPRRGILERKRERAEAGVLVRKLSQLTSLS